MIGRQKLLSSIFLPIVLAVIVAVANPLGVGDAVNARSTEFLLKATAPFYPTDSQNKISTVIIDEKSVTIGANGKDQRLDFPGFTYPPTLESYSQLIEAVISYKPKAVFVDILIQEDKKRMELDGFFLEAVLSDNLARKNNPGLDGSGYIPIFFPNPAAVMSLEEDVEDCDLSLMEEGGFFEKFSSQPRPSIIGIGDSLKYNIVSPSTCLRKNKLENSIVFSPAYTLYQEVCLKDPEFCSLEVQQGPQQALSFQRYQDAMMLRWSDLTTGLNKSYVKDGRKVCQQYEEGFFYEVGRSVLYFLNAIVSGRNVFNERNVRNLCPYHDTLSAKDLINRAISAKKDSNYDTQEYCNRIDDQLGDPTLEERLCGKVVFIGMNLIGLNDFTQSPVHGQTLGVILHAMALDNLLTFGSDYVKVSDPLFLNFEVGDVFEIIALVIFLSVEVIFLQFLFEQPWFKKWIPVFPKKPQALGLSTTYLKLILFYIIAPAILIFGLIFSLELIYFLTFKYPPNDWLGISSVACGAYYLFCRETIRLSKEAKVDNPD